MVKWTLPGFIFALVVVLIVAGFLASKITLGGADVASGVIPLPESLLHLAWSHFIEWIKEIL